MFVLLMGNIHIVITLKKEDSFVKIPGKKSPRLMSAYEFRTFLIAELRKQKIRIDLIDEERPLFAADNKVILFFPEVRKDERQIKALLLEILIPYLKTFVIAYAIQNKTGACIIRFELSDGFVSSH